MGVDPERADYWVRTLFPFSPLYLSTFYTLYPSYTLTTSITLTHNGSSSRQENLLQ